MARADRPQDHRRRLTAVMRPMAAAPSRQIPKVDRRPPMQHAISPRMSSRPASRNPARSRSPTRSALPIRVLLVDPRHRHDRRGRCRSCCRKSPRGDHHPRSQVTGRSIAAPRLWACEGPRTRTAASPGKTDLAKCAQAGAALISLAPAAPGVTLVEIEVGASSWREAVPTTNTGLPPSFAPDAQVG